MDYLRWNDLIAEKFFHSEVEGRRVFLSASQSLIDELANANSVTASDFIDAIRSGPPWAQGKGICVKAYSAFRGWRDRPLVYPPYIGYLALFVLAAEEDVDFSSRAYYPRLRSLLGELPETGQYSHFDRMRILWHDLEEWSINDMDGGLGTFRAAHSIGWIHVGYPISQAVLTPRERAIITEIFYESNVDPSTPPAARALSDLVLREAKGRLRKRTLDTLTASDAEESDLRALLQATITDILLDWDGSVPNQVEPGTTELRPRQIPLVLCLTIDRTKLEAKLTLRCRSKVLPPTDEIRIANLVANGEVRCRHWLDRWSTPLIKETGEILNACVLDWSQSNQGTGLDGQTSYVLAHKSVHVFVDASRWGFSGYIEINHIPYTERFYAIANQLCQSDIEKWGTAQCGYFKKFSFVTGLPEGWVLYEIGSATSDELVRDLYPTLTLPGKRVFELINGVRVGPGNRYLAAAPPSFYLEGGWEGLRMYLNGEPVDVPDGTDNIVLSNHESQIANFTFEVFHHDKQLQKVTVHLVDAPSWLNTPVERWLDRFGTSIVSDVNDTICYAGVLVNCDCPTDPSLRVYPELITEKRVYFLGRRPDEIAHWPDEPLPSEWKPVWSISVKPGNHPAGILKFCGESTRDETPICCGSDSSRSAKRWIDLIWHWRKRIVVPPNSDVRRLWKEYQNAARSL